MNIVDILIIVFLILYVIKGFKNGVLKELVSFIGGFIVIIGAFLLKNPLSVVLYEHLPFFKLGGIFAGISVINILIYEFLSFLIVAAVLWGAYSLILSITNIVEKILKITIILEIPSKILGMIVGFIEGIVVVFTMLFVCAQFEFTNNYLVQSKYSDMILTKTPILGNAVKPVYKSLQEIYSVAHEYKDSADKNAANLEALNIILKYKVLDVDNADKLVSEGKLNIENIETVLVKYRPATVNENQAENTEG